MKARRAGGGSRPPARAARASASALFPVPGARTRRLAAYLRRRAEAAPARRPELDRRGLPVLFHRRAVVFTDCADFTLRTIRDGILHFLMVFDRLARELEPVVRRTRGELVKAEADSLLLCYPSVEEACGGVRELERALRRLNEGRPGDEQLHFSYGIGYGDVLDLEGDVFGLEVNLASKLGEDLAQPGEALLTPSAARAAPARLRRRMSVLGTVRFGTETVQVQRLELR